MKSIITTLIFSTIILSCSTLKKTMETNKIVHQTNDLIITQVSENAFEFISFLQTKDYGVVHGNGLFVRSNNEVIIFNTTANDKSSEELIKWISDTLHCKINAVIPTHFHPDCLGGLKVFKDKNIPSYAYYKTIELAKENNFVVPENSFKDSLVLKVGDKKVIAKFLGEGHTKDNIIGYFPSENVMFGGCLIKEINATKGYLVDANVKAWSATVERVKREYPNVKVVIPGHGKFGNEKLLDYTIELFKEQ